MKQIIGAALILVLCMLVAPVAAGGGFDEFGYNYQARIFVGPADGVDRVLDGMVWGEPAYANDHLVMKWSKAWDDARFNGGPWTCDAWENNEWNGNQAGGSGVVEHYKIIWVGPDPEGSPCWREGGYPIWGEFEVIMDQGVFPGEGHVWYTHAVPNGYGSA
ncbi:MAG: hypothetical protein LUO97_04480 [Methanomicrobiales archaeon]|nr:hypothetical protein [Methanomicrobiales archaeon]